MQLQEVLNFRRSVRNFSVDQVPEIEKVKKCIELATLAPNSSNMQLWEFHHITNKEMIQQLAVACLGQSAVSTSNQVVVFVTRQDLYRRRSRQVLEFEIENIKRNSPAERQEKRMNDIKIYYGKMMPFLYIRFFGLLGIFRKLLTKTVSIFRPMFTDASECDQRVVVHKTCALAAQTFMIAMANEGYDTCPLEGFDSKRVKKLLNLPHGAEINMVVACGIRDENKGIRGDRYRVPFDEVYKQL